MIRLAAAPLTTLMLALGLVACGGDDAPTKAEFGADADKVCAAALMRDLRTVCIESVHAPPSGPRRAELGTRTPSRNSSAVVEPCMPSLSSTLPRSSPGASPGTRNAVTASRPALGSVVAKQMMTSARSPVVMKVFVPWRT